MMDFQGKRVTVMGLGRFGGGVGVARWLASKGARVVVTDLKPVADLAEPIADVQDLVDAGSVSLHLGGHAEADFADTDLVIANPAVPSPWKNAYLLAAERAEVPVNTEIGLLVEQLPDRRRVIGITGSVGKSTTTAMIAHALGGAGQRVALGGNIGGSLLGQAEKLEAGTWVVLELSSFMLHWLGRVQRWSPRVAVVTNIADNHTDWHGSFTHYCRSKQQLLVHQRPGDTAVLGETVADWSSLTQARVVQMGAQQYQGPLAVPGAHNRVNAAMALAVCHAADPELDGQSLRRALATFPGLPHRLSMVLERNGRRCYNDSKSTTPEAALRAVEALALPGSGTTDHVHLIAGGYDKGADLIPVARAASRLAGLYCIGETGPGLASTDVGGGHVELCGTLDVAVRSACGRMRAGDVLLLSPACASWDQYPNYEHRGEHFTRLVHESLTGGGV